MPTTVPEGSVVEHFGPVVVVGVVVVVVGAVVVVVDGAVVGYRATSAVLRCPMPLMKLDQIVTFIVTSPLLVTGVRSPACSVAAREALLPGARVACGIEVV